MLRTVDEDLVQIRRSLAMASTLPGNVAAELVDEIERLRRTRRDLAAELDELAEQVARLRQRIGDP